MKGLEQSESKERGSLPGAGALDSKVWNEEQLTKYDRNRTGNIIKPSSNWPKVRYLTEILCAPSPKLRGF